MTETTSSANQTVEDDDEWLDWETRKDSIPIFKHMIAGKWFGNGSVGNVEDQNWSENLPSVLMVILLAHLASH